MKKFILATVASLVLMCSSAYAEPLNLNQILEATARVGTFENYGSGTVVAKQNGKYFILTNAHVVGEAEHATVEFFTRGSKTLPIIGDVVWRAHQRNTGVDFALITISTSSLSTWKPRIIPLVSYNYDIKTNTYIQSAGSPEARWPMAWEGRVTQDKDNRLIFTPAPTMGQSGAGLLVNVPDANGELHTRVGGIVTWRINNQPAHLPQFDSNGYDISSGGAISIDKLYDAMAGKINSSKVVPPNYSIVGTSNSPETLPAEKALGSDGKYYRVVVEGSEMEAVNLPIGIKIIRWPNFEVRQPANPLVPALNFNALNNGYGYSGGYNFGNEGFFEVDPNDEKVDDLIRDLAEQKKQMELLDLELNTLRVEKANLQAELARVKGQAVPDTSKVKALEDKEEKIDDLSDTLKTMQAKQAADAKAIQDAQIEMEEVKRERNIYGVSTILTIISGVVLFFWKKLGRKKIGDLLNKVEDKLEDKANDKIDPELVKDLRNIIDGLEERIADAIDKKAGTNKDTKPDPDMEKLIEAITDALKKQASPPVVVVSAPLRVDEKKYTASEILDAVQAVSSSDPALAHVANMVRQTLKTK